MLQFRLTDIHAGPVKSPRQLHRLEIGFLIRFLEQNPQILQKFLPEQAQLIPKALTLRNRMFIDPAAAGEVIEILARIHGSVHRAYHSRRYDNKSKFIVNHLTL